MTAEQEQLFGIDKLNVARSDIPGRDACRLLRAHPDGRTGKTIRCTTI